MSSSKATLLFQGTTHRLIARGTYSAGYEDEYILEKSETDALGGERWIEAFSWRPGNARSYARNDEHPSMTALVALLKEALAKETQAAPPTAVQPATQIVSILDTLIGGK